VWQYLEWREKQYDVRETVDVFGAEDDQHPIVPGVQLAFPAGRLILQERPLVSLWAAMRRRPGIKSQSLALISGHLIPMLPPIAGCFFENLRK
jgi:hypothetical protein